MILPKNLLKHVVVLISLVIVVFPIPSLASDPAGQLVAFSGEVWISSGHQNPWRKVTGKEVLYPGYSVRTGRLSAASLRMEDESLMRLSQNAEFKVEEVQLSSFWRRATALVSGVNRSLRSSYRLISGKLWGRNNNRSLDAQIITTTATIGIRGTEYMIEASENASTVSIQEGVVVAENERGQAIIRSGEQVVTRAGQAPQRSSLVQSSASVQWTIQVPELIDLSTVLKKANLQRSNMIRIEQAYRQSNYATALELLAQEQEKQPDSSAIQLIRAWIHIKAGNSVEVYPRLKTLSAQYPNDVSLQEMMAFSAFLSTQYAEARNIIQQLQQRRQLTDTGWVVSAYLHQAAYDLAAAEQAYLAALEINPASQPAQLQLATLYFASEQNQRALARVSKLAASNPDYVAASNLKGFILLANNKTTDALAEWEKSEKSGVADAETYFGLSLAYMRKGQVEPAMQSIATAVLLDPQRSMYLSYWGKMLHQIGRNDKALTVLDSAIRLDQQDPTPRLYQAIILRDMNRPGEAIRHLQAAVELNDKRGVYRSRSLLDQDLAVQNVDLSRLFTQLGLAEWAHKKAIDSIKSDFTNVSAHILNAGAYAGMGDRAYALANEALLARLMQPANINAFSSFNSYTSLYETPATEFDLQLGLGNHQQQNASLIVAGALPEQAMAWSVAAVHEDTEGWRDTNGETFDDLSLIAKWQPSPKNNFMFTLSAFEFERLDDFFPRYELDSVVDPFARFDSSSIQLEFGLHHKLKQNHDLLAYLSINDVDFESDDITRHDAPLNVLGDLLPTGAMRQIDAQRPFTQLQLQAMSTLDNHQLHYGVFAYTGKYKADTFSGDGVFRLNYDILAVLNSANASHDLDVDFYSVYVKDSIKLNPALQLDLAIYADKMDNADAVTGGEWSLDEITTRLGLIWQLAPQQTLRLASFEYLLPFISARLDPTDIAGIPIFKNTNEGSLVSESDLVWDFEWSTGLLSTAIFKVQESFTSAVLVAGNQLETTSKSEKQGISITLNTLLGLSTGLNVGFTSFDVEDGSLPALDRKENNLSIGLTHVYPNSLSVGAKHVVREMNFDGTREEGNINVTSLLVGYEFDNKRQQFEFEVSNLFDQKFNWVTDKFSTSGIAPERLFTARYRVSF